MGSKIKTWSTYWYPEDLKIVSESYEKGLSFDEIAEKLNSYRKSLAEVKGQVVILRTGGAVAYRLLNLGLIKEDQVENYYRGKQKEKSKFRSKDLDKERKLTFERDNHKCVHCGDQEGIEFAHVVAYRYTKINDHREAITLCKKHHEFFDEQGREMTLFIASKMQERYPNFLDTHSIRTITCDVHGERWEIIRKKN